MNLLTDLIKKDPGRYSTNAPGKYGINSPPQQTQRMSSLPPIPAFKPYQPLNDWQADLDKKAREKREMKNLKRGLDSVKKLKGPLTYETTLETLMGSDIPPLISDKLATKIISGQAKVKKNNLKAALDAVLVAKKEKGKTLSYEERLSVLGKYLTNSEAISINDKMEARAKPTFKKPDTRFRDGKEEVWDTKTGGWKGTGGKELRTFKQIVDDKLKSGTKVEELTKEEKIAYGIKETAKAPTMKEMGGIYYELDKDGKWVDSGFKKTPGKHKYDLKAITDYYNKHAYDKDDNFLGLDNLQKFTIEAMIKESGVPYELKDRIRPARRSWVGDVGEPNIPEATITELVKKDKSVSHPVTPEVKAAASIEEILKQNGYAVTPENIEKFKAQNEL